MKKKLSKLGAISFKTFHDSKLQANLFSTINGKEKLNGGGIILSGHTDVVPASPKEWASNPYVAKEKRQQNLRQRIVRYERIYCLHFGYSTFFSLHKN